jgi:Fe-S-cluster containining protein
VYTTRVNGRPLEQPIEDAAVVSLHAEVDRETRRLHVLHAARLECRRSCSSCCVDELTVFDVEAEPIRRRHTELLATGVPHAKGACAFLDPEGACRIYAERPYVCRTQGLPLRWIEQREGHPVERRDICPLNESGEPIEHLPAGDCWTLGPFEERLARLQLTTRSSSAPLACSVQTESSRIPLRALFVTK